jgi:hypothetical protein
MNARVKKPPRFLTVRNVPVEVARALERERRRHGVSLNQTVIALLSRSLGVGAGETQTNGLRRLSGTWSKEDCAQFEAAIAPSEQIDEEVWR